MYYHAEFYADKKNTTSGVSVVEVTKEISAKWNAFTPKQKQKYEAQEK